MIGIITNKFICNRRLRAHCFYCRMSARQTCRSIKTRIRNAVDTHTAIVIFYIFYQPIYGIIRITAFVHIFVVFFIYYVWSYFKVHSLTHVPSPYILINKNIFFIHQCWVWTNAGCITGISVRAGRVWRTLHKYGIFFFSVFRHINNRVQFYSISHFYNGIYFYKIFFYKISICLCGCLEAIKYDNYRKQLLH